MRALCRYIYRSLRGEMYWFRLLFLLTSFGFACSSVLPRSGVLRLLLTGVFFAFDTLVVSVWTPFEQSSRNVLSAATSAFGVVQCEVLLALAQLGVQRAADSGGGVNLGYSQQGVQQAQDPSSALTGDSDFAGWCAVYLALAIAADTAILAAVYRHALHRAGKRAVELLSDCATRLQRTAQPLLACVRSALCSRATSEVEAADPQRYRRESVVDVIKTRILMVRTLGSRRGSQPQLARDADKSGPHAQQQQPHPLGREQHVGQRASVAAEAADDGRKQFELPVAPAPQTLQMLPPLKRVGGAARVNEQSAPSDDAVELPAAPAPLLAEYEERSSAVSTPKSALNLRLIRLPVLVNPHLPASHSHSHSTSHSATATPRTPRSPPLTSRSVKRQARLSRRNLALAPSSSHLASATDCTASPAPHTPAPSS